MRVDTAILNATGWGAIAVRSEEHTSELQSRYRGAPLRDEEKLRIALNNYRAAGSGGYTMFRDAPIVWRSGREIRDLMVEYFRRARAAARGPGRQLAHRAAGRGRDPGAGGDDSALISDRS